jgi:hypothetical protein
MDTVGLSVPTPSLKSFSLCMMTIFQKSVLLPGLAPRSGFVAFKRQTHVLRFDIIKYFIVIGCAISYLYFCSFCRCVMYIQCRCSLSFVSVYCAVCGRWARGCWFSTLMNENYPCYLFACVIADYGRHLSSRVHWVSLLERVPI